MPERLIIPFFTDHNIPDSLGEFLKLQGHHVARLRDSMPTDTADQVLAVACAKSGSVLITDDKDFRQRQNSKKLDINLRYCNNSLHRIIIRCEPPNAVKNIANALHLIEAEWSFVKEGKPMYIEIWENTVSVSRQFW